MADVRVRLPLGTSLRLRDGAWESLAIRLVRDQETAGSNPAAPTDRDCRTGVRFSRVAELADAPGCSPGHWGFDSLPLSLSMYPDTTERKGKPTGDGSRLESGRAMSLGGSTPPPSALPLFPTRGSFNGRTPAFQAGDAGSTPHPALDSFQKGALGRAVEAPASHAGQAGSTPAGRSRG